MVNGTPCFEFEEFEFEDFLSYQNDILIQVLRMKLHEKKGNLKALDLEDAYQECWVIIQQDLEKWCRLKNSSDCSVNVNITKCCLTQIQDARDQERDAMGMAEHMKPYLVCRLYDQPANKRLAIIADLKTDFQLKSQVEIPSGATFPGFFQELFQDMNAIDNVMSGNFFKLKPALEGFLREVGPRIVLRTKKYYTNPQLKDDKCKFCNSRWVKWVQEPSGTEITNLGECGTEITNLGELCCFRLPEDLESFLVLRFRQTFFQELLDYLNFLDHYFSIDRFEN